MMLSGVRNDLAVLTFFYTALTLPFVIWLLFGLYKQIPVELEEAAIVDWASPVANFLSRAVAADEVLLCRGGDVHLPHRLERIYPRPIADREENRNTAGRGHRVSHRYRRRMGAHHGDGNADRDPTLAVQLSLPPARS
ncbi:MAG: hypothetical protein V6Z86_01540 [Hyphomicrobiales bacterium]